MSMQLCDLLILWTKEDSLWLRITLLEETNPGVVSAMLDTLPPSSKGWALKHMSNKQRRHVVQT